MSDNTTPNLSERYGITPSGTGLVKLQGLYADRVKRLRQIVESASNRIGGILDAAREEITEDDEARAQVMRDAFFQIVAKLEDAEQQMRFYLSVQPVLEALAEHAEESAEDIADRTVKDENKESANNAEPIHAEAQEMRELANNLFSVLGAMGSLPKDLKTKDRKVRGGNTATVLDWPRLPDVSKAATGQTRARNSLPVFTIDDIEYPHGETFRAIAKNVLSDSEKQIGARDLQALAEEEIGPNWRKTGGVIEWNEHTIDLSEYRTVGGDDDE